MVAQVYTLLVMVQFQQLRGRGPLMQLCYSDAAAESDSVPDIRSVM